jgi:hypothetical protein
MIALEAHGEIVVNNNTGGRIGLQHWQCDMRVKYLCAGDDRNSNLVEACVVKWV